MERKNKVSRLDEIPVENEIDDGGERSDNELSDMDKLPNEILMKILDYLDEQQLVKCRLLSSRWNEISCLLLQDKSKNNPDSKLVVALRKYLVKDSLGCKVAIFGSLGAFTKCFSPSEAEKSSGRLRPFPFSRFTFQGLGFMDVTQLCEFVSNFGLHMKTVLVDIKSKDVVNFERFWKLLLHFAPSVHHLVIKGDSSLAKVTLIDPINKFFARTDPNLKLPKDKLLSLKVLEINSRRFGEFNNFMKDLLDSAPNLQQVSYHGSDSFFGCNGLKSLQVWQQLNKAHLVKRLFIQSNSQINFPPPAKLMKNLGLDSLGAFCCLPSKYMNKENSISNYIHHALKSSQNTLSFLYLSNLTVEIMSFCFKNISTLPNVRQLQIQIQDSMQTEALLRRFSQLCPNITRIRLELIFVNDFSKAAQILWTGFQGLKHLSFSLDMTQVNADLLALDYAFSGYSQESIQRIQTKLELDGQISLTEATRNEKQNPSILDLKSLNGLELQFVMGIRTEEREKVENQLRNSVVFMKILPQHIRETPGSFIFRYV